MQTIKQIQEDEVYKQVLRDSFGGIIYDVANRNKYDDEQIIKLWDSMSPAEQESAGGIMKGAFNFLKGV